jgi:DNA repair protein RadC
MNGTAYRISDLPAEERPRERLVQCGAEALSSAELLAIILGSGTRGVSVLQLAQHLLNAYGDIRLLAEATLHELMQFKGMGYAKALQLKAAFGLCVRLQNVKGVPRTPISSPWHAYQILRDSYATAQQEHFIVLLQDTKSCLIRSEVVAIGTLNEMLVHPREVFYPAIRHKAATVVLAHNHPSGDPEPSSEDLSLTKQLCLAGEMLQIAVVDHLILGADRFVSLRQRGLDCFSVAGVK